MSKTHSSFLLIAILHCLLACGSPDVVYRGDGNQGLTQIDKIQLMDAQICASSHINRIINEGVLFDQDLRPDHRGRIPVRYIAKNFTNQTTNHMGAASDLNPDNMFSFVSQELTRTGKMVVTSDVDSAELEVKIRVYNESERGEKGMFSGPDQSNVILMEFQLLKGSTQIYSYAKQITKANYEVTG